MSRDAYFHYLDETAAAVGPYIATLYEQQYRDSSASLFEAIMKFPGPRSSRPIQKPGLFRLVFEICGGSEWRNLIPVAAAFEILNISSYQANSSFDEKCGTLSREDKDAQFISAMLSRELACEAIRGCHRLSGEQKLSVSTALSRINECIYRAQHLDLFVLHQSNLEAYRGHESRFLTDYFQRCRLGSGVFNAELMACAADLAGNDAARQEFAAIGEIFGTALHLINDLGDYAPAIENQPHPRAYQDRYSDFRNGRLTIVLYHLLTMSAPEVAETVRALQITQERSDSDLHSLSELVYTTGAFGYCRAHAKRMFHDARSLAVRYSSHALYPLLLQSLSVLRNNKYTTAFTSVFGQDRTVQ